MKRRKLAAVLLISALAASLAACGSSETDSSSADSELSTESEEFDASEEEDVTAAATELYEQLKEYANAEDYDSFAALYSDTEDTDIETCYNTEYPAESDGVNVVLIASADDHYYVGITDYTVEGTFPDSSASSNNYTMTVVQSDDGDWTFTVDEEIDDYIFTTDQIPDDMADAVDEEYNYAWFDPDNYMYLDDSYVYTGVADSAIKFAWQDEDGNLSLAIWLMNGTDENISFNESTTLTLVDDELGEILSLDDYEIDTIVNANSSTVLIVTIDAEEVSTGTDTWSGSLSASIPINFEVTDEEATEEDTEDSDEEISDDEIEIDLDDLEDGDYEIEIEEEE